MLEKETKRSQVEGCVGRRAHMEFDTARELKPSVRRLRLATGHDPNSSSWDRTSVLPGCVCVRVSVWCAFCADYCTRPVYIFTLRRFCCRRIELQLSCGQSGTVRLE